MVEDRSDVVVRLYTILLVEAMLIAIQAAIRGA